MAVQQAQVLQHLELEHTTTTDSGSDDDVVVNQMIPLAAAWKRITVFYLGPSLFSFQFLYILHTRFTVATGPVYYRSWILVGGQACGLLCWFDLVDLA